MQAAPARPQASDAEFQELSLGDLLLMLWRGRWIILICTAVLTGIGFKYVQQRGTIWRASSRLYVDASAPSMLSGDGSLVSMGNRNYSNTQAELLRSTKVLDQTLLRPEIAASPVFPEETNKVGWLKEALKVSVGLKDDIVSVSLDSAQVAEACLIVNGVVDTFRRLHSEKGNSRAREMKGIAVSNRDKEQASLDALHGLLITFLSDNGSIALDDRTGGSYATRQLDSAFQELRRLEGELQVSKTRLETARSLVDQPRLMREFLGDNGQPQDRKSDRIAELSLADVMRRSSELSDEMRAAKHQRTNLLEQGRTVENPMVVALEQQLSDLGAQEAQLRDELGEIEQRLNENEQRAESAYAASLLATLERQQSDLDARVAAAQGMYAELETTAKAVAPKRAELRRLETRINQSEAIIEGLNVEISDYSKADISEEERSKITIEILDRASPDTAKVAQSVPKTLAIFLLLGGLLGCGLAWLRALMDRKVRTDEDVVRATGLHVVGALPRTKLAVDKVDAIKAWEDHHALAEAARGLRTAITFSLPKGKGKVIQMTSADKGDGKSTTVAQLAVAMAQSGQRTLLIDADLRSPRVAKVFHFSNDEGLSNILAQGVKSEEVIRKSRLNNLDILTSGPIPINPAELLNGEEFTDLLVEVAQRYDRILIDTPPVLAVSDARVVAVRVEATLLVVRVDKSDRRRVEAAMERLASVGIRPLGVILNDVPRGIGYGHGYGYGYGGRYGYGDAPGVNLAEDTPSPSTGIRAAEDDEPRVGMRAVRHDVAQSPPAHAVAPATGGSLSSPDAPPTAKSDRVPSAAPSSEPDFPPKPTPKRVGALRLKRRAE